MSDHKVYQDDLSIDPDDGRIRLNQLKEEDGTLNWSVLWGQHHRFIGSGWFLASELVLLRLDPVTEAYLPRILEWMGVDVSLIQGMVAMHKNWILMSEDERRGLGTVREVTPEQLERMIQGEDP